MEYFKNIHELDLELRILELKSELYKEKVNLELAKIKEEVAPANLAQNLLISQAVKVPAYLFSRRKKKSKKK